MREHVGPTFFLNTIEYGWFYPFYAFYGGTLYYVAALTAVAFDSVWSTYVASYMLASAAAFYAWVWLARQAAVWNPTAYVLASVFIAAPYYVTDAYGRGAWPEFIEISMLPLVLATGWSLLTTNTVTAWDAMVLVVAMVILTGSHSITLLFGVLFVGIVFCIALLLRPSIRRRRAGLVICLALLSILVNGWFLVPLVAYLPTISLGLEVSISYREYDSLEVIFSFMPNNPLAPSTPDLYVQAPVLALVAAVLVSYATALLVRTRPLLLMTLATTSAFAGVLAAIVASDAFWRLCHQKCSSSSFRIGSMRTC